MKKKIELKKVMDAIDDVGSEKVIQKPVIDLSSFIKEQQENSYKLLSDSIIKALKADTEGKFDEKVNIAREGLEKTLLELSKDLESFKKKISEDTALQEYADSVEVEIDSIYAEINTLQETVDEAFLESYKGSEVMEKSLLSLSEKVDGIAKSISGDFLKRFDEVKKTHKSLDSEIKSLNEGHATHLKKFEIIDKNFLKFEKDLKKYASEIYEYGSSFSILKNGSLVGMTNGLNLVAGSGMTINVAADSSGAITATFISSGGGSGYQAPLSGGLSGTNTWTTSPNVIVVDQGRSMQATSTDGKVNFTVSGSGPYATVLTVNPTFDVYSTA